MPGLQEDRDQREVAHVPARDGEHGADSAGPGDRPARGSAADLRQRLERLPHGHPSSPYHDDGTPRPPLVRLKNLELPLPGEERDLDGGTHHDPAHPAAGAPEFARWDQVAAPHEQVEAPPDQVEATHEQAADVSQHDAGADPYADGADAYADGADAYGGAGGGADPYTDPYADADADAAEQDRWAQDLGPIEQGAGTDLDDEEPATQDQEAIVDDRAADIEHVQAAAAERLTPEQVRIAVRALGQCRLAEGRSVFGSYDERGLTPAMRRIEEQLEHGELVPDTEKYALKSLDRFQEKLAKLIARNPDKSSDELAHEIHDGVRYTFVFDEDRYYDGTREVHSKLEEQGFDLEVRRNTWTDPEYKGINSRWHDPDHNVLFEVQFHTMASWDAKQRTHEVYERISDTRVTPQERARLREAQREISGTVPLPPRCTEIPDYRKEGR
jgi:hypothetical protein